MQALHKGAEVYIADFKGGVDFPKVWHEKCRMCFAEEDLRYTLDQLVAVLEYRKSAFKALGCPNIDAYPCFITVEFSIGLKPSPFVMKNSNTPHPILSPNKRIIQTLATRLIRENCNLASTLIIRIASRTSISFSIFMFSRSPWSNSITDMFKASARCSKIETSGKPTPVSLN